MGLLRQKLLQKGCLRKTQNGVGGLRTSVYLLVNIRITILALFTAQNSGFRYDEDQKRMIKPRIRMMMMKANRSRKREGEKPVKE